MADRKKRLEDEKPDPRMQPGFVKLGLDDFVMLLDAAQYLLNNVTVNTTEGRLRRAALEGVVKKGHEAMKAILPEAPKLVVAESSHRPMKPQRN